jgi:hypothetical protein
MTGLVVAASIYFLALDRHGRPVAKPLQGTTCWRLTSCRSGHRWPERAVVCAPRSRDAREWLRKERVAQRCKLGSKVK